MEDKGQQFVMTEQTTQGDYVVPQMCYVPSEQVYTPPSLDSVSSLELPGSVSDIYNTKLNEITNTVEKTINSYEDASALNAALDKVAYDSATQQNYLSLTQLIESGIPTTKAVEIFKQYQNYQQAYGSGLYSSLAESRIIGQASDNLIMNTAYADPENDAAELYEAMQNTMVNYQALDDMVTKAFAKDNERGILTKMAVGVAGGALLPFEQNWNAARKFKNIIKNRLGDTPEVKDISDSWNMNKVVTAARKALMRKATGSINNFKQLLNDIDQDLLEDKFLTLGDRANFWSQVQNTTISLNRFAFGAELVGCVPILKAGVGAAKAGITATGSVVKGVTRGILKTTVSATSLDSLAAVTKAAKRPISLLRFTGQTKKGEGMLDDLLRMSVTERTINPLASSDAMKNASREFLENGMPPAYSPVAEKMANTLDTSNVNIICDALDELDTADAKEAILLAQNVANTPLKGLSTETQQDALGKFVDKYLQKKVANKKPLDNVNMISNDKGFVLETMVGTGQDYKRPFYSDKSAQKFADSINSNGGVYKGFAVQDTAIVERTAAGPFVKIQRKFVDGERAANLGDLVSAAVKESQFAGKNTGKQFSKTWVGKFLAGSHLTADFFTKRLNDLKQSSEGMNLRLFGKYFKSVDKLNSGDKLVLDALQHETATQGAYFSTSALRKSGIPENIIEAYRSEKIMRDAAWLLRAKGTTEGMIANNVKNIHFKDFRIGLGQQIDRPTDRATINMLKNVTKDKDGIKFVTEKLDMSNVKSEDVKFIRLTNAIEGDNIIAINNKSFSMKNPSIMDTVFSYKPGSMIFAPGTGFIKQAIPSSVEVSKGVFKDVVTDIRTIFAHPIANRVQEATETLEAFRQEAILVSKGKSLLDAQRDIQKIKGWESIGDFETFYKLTQGKDPFISLHPDAIFQYVPDGGELKFKGEKVGFNFKGMSATQYTNSEKVLNAKMRGESDVFNPFNFGEAPRLNSTQEMSLATQGMMRYSTLDDYTKLYAENFANAFGDLLDKNASDVHNLLYFNPESKKSEIDFATRQRIYNAQRNYKRMMSTATEFDEWIEGFMTKFADQLVPDLKNAGPDRLALYEKWAGSNPIRKAKAWTFNWYLSMYNPKQLWTQYIASINALEMRPDLGWFAFKNHLPIMAYFNSGDESTLRKASKLFRTNYEELKEVADIAKKLDVYTQAAPGGLFELNAREAANAAKVSWWDPASMYLKGEYGNRTFTAIMAAKEAYNKGARAATISWADVANLTSMQQKWYMNMGRAGTSHIQQGLWGFMTQFKGYPMRFFESFLSKELTAGEKWRLGLLHSVAGGMKGIVGGKFASKIYASLFSNPSEERTPFEELSYHGLVDYLAMRNGVNVSFGNAWSASLGDLVDLALESDLSGMAPFTTMITKPVGFAATVYDELSRHFKLDPNERTLKGFWTGFGRRLATERTLPGGGNNLLAGFYSFMTGQKLDTSGQLTAEGRDALDSFLTATGFKDIKEDQLQLVFAEHEKLRSDKNEQKKFANKLLSFHLNAVNQEDADQRSAQLRDYLSTIADYDAELAHEIIKEVYSSENLRRLTTEKQIMILESLAKSAPRFKAEFEKALKEVAERQQTQEQ